MKRLGITWRLFGVLLLVALLPLLMFQQTLTRLFTEELSVRLTADLAAIADNKATEINSIVEHQVNNAELLSNLPSTVRSMQDIDKAYRENGLFSQRYRQLRQPYLKSIAALVGDQNFYDMLLIAPNGEVIFSYKQEADLGTNLFNGTYRNTQLAKVVRQTLLVLENGVSDFEWYEPSKAHAVFITATVMDGTRVLGTLAVQLNPSEIERVVKNDEGLGNSGETVLAQRVDADHAKFITSLRYAPDIGPDRPILLSANRATPMVHALTGEHGQGEMIDYRQTKVLAAWRYLPRTRWGLVVKMDVQEAYAPIRRWQDLALALLAVALSLAAGMAYWLGRSIVRPVERLTRAATMIAGGDLHQRVEVLHDDEVGQLGVAFNRMTDHLEYTQNALLEAHESLEQKVQQRTEALQWEEERTRTILDNVLDGIISLTDEGRIVSFSKSAERIFGFGASELIGRSITTLMPEAFAERHRQTLNGPGAVQPWPDNHTIADLKEFIGSGREILARRKVGSTFPLRISLSEAHLGERRVFVASVQDVTEIQRAESTLRLYASVFEHSGEAILISDNDRRILAVNPAFTDLMGYTIDEIKGMDPRMLSSDKTPPQTYQNQWTTLPREGFWQGETWNRTKDGRIFPNWMSISVVRDLDGATTHYIASFIDITERKAAEERITHLAHHDALTGLLNRLSLTGRLEQALATVQREQRQLAVMFIDMDRFKTINDTLGHAAGDKLLVDVAKRLGEIVRNSDIVARLGGDEFVVVLTEVDGAASVARVAEKVLNSLGQSYTIGKHEVHSTPSIGLAFYPSDGNDSEMLMKNADTAMYHAKAQGRNNVQFFAPEMNMLAIDRLHLEHDMRVALESGQFELHYQPRLAGGSRRFVSVEALLRWRNPQQGLMLPESFIHIAEETGLILPLGEWVLNEACRQLRAWRDQGLVDVGMTVNLSSRQLHMPTLPAFIGRTLEKHGLTGADLELEIAEAAVMNHPETSIARLKELHDVGVQLSIDNFGTAYSSLNYLKLMPIHTLKIDQSLVQDIDIDASKTTICNATITLAHNLGLSVVAEGVETEGQRDFLIENHCDFMQGFLFSQAVDADAALAFIRASLVH